MEILAFVLSTLGTVCICISPLLKGKDMGLILLLVFFTNALMAASYVLTGAFNGAATCSVAAIMSIINFFFEQKSKPLPVWLIVLYAATFTLVNLLIFAHITDIIALLAALVLIAQVSQKSGKAYRLLALANTILWIIYDLITSAFGPLCTHAILLATILFRMIVHDKKHKK